MSKYLRKFETEAEYSAATIYRPSVSLISDEMTVIFDPKPHDYSEDYLTFRALEDGTFSFSGTSSANCLSYSTDSGATWSEPSSAITTSTLSSGNTILWKASGLKISSSGIGRFSSTGQFEAEGNIMSLHFGDNFSGQTSLSGMNYAFSGLFSGCTTITSAENLILPATTLAEGCYRQMFYNCSGLTTAPVLSATTLATNCCQEMFRNCTGLTTSPSVLPATTLADYCYSQMFYNCTSLTTAPELPATTLVYACYIGMLRGCSSLTTAPELPATTLADYCYKNMFNGCTSLTTAPELPATTLVNQCYYTMFQGCTSLTTAPELPATTLANSCYRQMFQGCTSLNSIICLATDISANSYTAGWVQGVAASGTFTKAASMSSWTTGNNGIPSGWTVVDYSE